MAVVYFDPRYDREYFYSIIKPLCLIYDQIVIWSPNADDLEEHQFPVEDFISACKPKDSEDYPVIIPAGRDSWFNRNARKNHPDINDRNYSESFDSIISDIAILNELWKNGEEEIKAKTWKN